MVDVYALGVLFYELLAGRLPYNLHSRMIHGGVRAIRDKDRIRLSRLPSTGTGVSVRDLRGDVETIIGKALEKEKERRYATADALARDIRRCLRNEPITARPPHALP
jgi:serine/threonine protein kinase